MDRRTVFAGCCVAVDGDTVVVRDNVLHVNGEPQICRHQKYEGMALRLVRDWPPDRPYYVVPADHCFVMGDNRNNSRDSRLFHRDGAREPAVPHELLVGKAMFIYASFDFDRGFSLRLTRMPMRVQ